METDKLLHWFNENKRDLPWRENSTPYRVWVSEVMLQQTRASVVIPYFLRWMDLFPTIEELAKAPFTKVLKMWEGLGYYTRVRNLHLGAQQIMEEFGGEIPNDLESLGKIKGIGPYTKGAILAFGFKKAAAAVDGNVKRVLSRYYFIEDPIDERKGAKRIEELAEEIAKRSCYGVTEGLIELGAVVCKRVPDCQSCPVKGSCKAFIKGEANSLPIKKKKQETIFLQRAVVVLSCGDHFLVRQNKRGELMGDLHEFPYFGFSESKIVPSTVKKWVFSQFKEKGVFIKTLSPIQQSFTRYQVTLYPFWLKLGSRSEIRGWDWVDKQMIGKLSFSSGHRKILSCVV